MEFFLSDYVSYCVGRSEAVECVYCQTQDVLFPHSKISVRALIQRKMPYL